MRITLTKSQGRASEEIMEQALDNLNYKPENAQLIKDIMFYAPTGGGKTVVMSMTIKKLIKKYKGNIAFLWLSIGKGRLHIQSLNKLEQCIGKAVTCGLLERGKVLIDKNEVSVINWEGINKHNNLFIKYGDMVDFFTICENTKESSKLCLIIDESHKNLDTAIGREIRKRIDPDVVVKMSATPTDEPTVKITHKELTEECIVRKHAVLNEGVENYMNRYEVDKLHAALEMSYRKRLELKTGYNSLDVVANPLNVVQVPNGSKGDRLINACKAFFARKDINEENGKLAVWVTNRDGNTAYATKGFDKDKVSDPDNKVEVLIFKQAVDTGWDCPRAQIWVKLRDKMEPRFSIQTLGRIMRTLYRQYYEKEFLNLAYVYTDSTFTVELDDLDPFIIDYEQAELKEEVNNVVLDKYHKKWDNRMLKGSFNKSLNTVFREEFGMTAEIDRNKNILSNLGFDMSMETLTSKIAKHQIIDQDTTEFIDSDVEGFDSREDLEEKLEDLIAHSLSKCEVAKNSAKKSIGALYFWANQCLGYEPGYNINGWLSFFIRNWEGRLDSYFMKAVHKYIPLRILEKDLSELSYESWSMNRYEYYGNNYEEVPHHKYAYEPCYLRIKRSQPEKDFEKMIDRREDVVWWIKNRDYGHDYFSVPYQKKNGEMHSFYVDYVVQFANGMLGFFDPKGGVYAASEDAAAKSKGLLEYIQKWDHDPEKSIEVFGGVLSQARGLWKICQTEQYDYDEVLNHWDNFVEVLSSKMRSETVLKRFNIMSV